MRKLPMAVFAMAAMVCGFANADTPNGTTGTATAPQADPNERICKHGEVITGSRFPGPRVCHTRMEWEQIQRNSNEGLQGRMNRMSTNNTGGGFIDGDR
jgi:hypothetical protein